MKMCVMKLGCSRRRENVNAHLAACRDKERYLQYLSTRNVCVRWVAGRTDNYVKGYCSVQVTVPLGVVYLGVSGRGGGCRGCLISGYSQSVSMA